MLAVVDVFGIFLGRIQRKRCRAAPEKGAGLMQLDLESDRAQSGRGSKPGQPAADDDYAGYGGAPPVSRSFSAWTTIHAFSKSLSRARCVKTS